MSDNSNKIKRLLEGKKAIDEQLSEITDSVRFSVDAGIINRLGKELVGRAETAVSELVKNSYDADANQVKLRYINSDKEGGTLIIEDDGHGMTRAQLLNGFMRLSSPDKIENPVSPKYNRVRAGKKGIGRFATQRLGESLTIITKTKDDDEAIKLEIDWSRYEVNQNLVDIFNPTSKVDYNFPKNRGTKLIIEGLREGWTEAQIKRVYKYVSELLQPNFISDRSGNLNIAKDNSEDSFNVEFTKENDNEIIPIANLDKMVLDHSLGVIEGYAIDGKGICEVVSNRFGINDSIEIKGDFSNLDNIHFKVYYFIYNFDYYKGYIPKMEYNRVSSFGHENGGVKLYRNGFRVLPYGESRNDWLKIERTALKAESSAHVPFGNNNFFGFVEIIDADEPKFEETSSREGLLENDAYYELVEFVNISLRQATQRINAARLVEKKKRKNSSSQNPNPSNNTNDNKTTKEKLEDLKTGANDDIIDEVILEIEELEMMRVLAGVGLTIAEFTHEIRQFIPSFNGSISYLTSQDLVPEVKESLANLKENFNRFKSYTAYIDSTFAQNSNREKSPQKLRKVVADFSKIIKADTIGANITFEEDFYGYDLYTRPMHPSEWTSILYNLYTNSKKAINRAEKNPGLIKIIGGRENGKVYLEFLDNGDGIPKENSERIFDPFFTTSTPASADAEKNEIITGTGLGLKIVKDIIEAYLGNIFISEPESNFSTCFRIEIPESTEKDIEQYGL